MLQANKLIGIMAGALLMTQATPSFADGACGANGFYSGADRRCYCLPGYEGNGVNCNAGVANALGITKLASGHMAIRFKGSYGVTYTIEATSDLTTQNWTAIGSATPDAFGFFIFEDMNNAGVSIRFYRARPQVTSTPTALSAAEDPIVQATIDTANELWGPEVSKLDAISTAAAFVSAIPTLRVTPAESSIVSLLATHTLGDGSVADQIHQLILSLNRSDMSAGAKLLERSIFASLKTNTSRSAAVYGAIWAVINALNTGNGIHDSSGVEQSFLIFLSSAVPNNNARVKTSTQSALSQDIASTLPTLDAGGKTTYRLALFIAYLNTNPDPVNEVMPMVNALLSAPVAQVSASCKTSILKQLFARNPGLLATYLAAKPLVAFAHGDVPSTLGFNMNAPLPVNVTSKTATFMVTRGSSIAGQVSVDYSTSNGTAAAGVDYVSQTGTLTWAEGDSADKIITVPLLGNLSSGASRSFNLTLANQGGRAVLTTLTAATVTIPGAN